MELKKALIVSYYWPPAGGPGVQRWLYFSRYLKEFGVQPVIYTPENPHYPILDPALELLIPDDLPVYRKKIWEPYHLASWISPAKTRRISSGIINREQPSALERLLLWIRGNLFIPDARKFWVRPSVTFLAGILKREGIDMVITTGPPHSLHLIGMSLREQTGVRWIADFRDPWTSIGYHKALHLSKRAQMKHKALEHQVLSRADAIITTSERTRKEFQGITSRPIHVITNGYVEGPFKKDQPEGKFRLAHIGSLLSGRNPVSLWKALSTLRQEYPEFARDLEIDLTGVVSEEVLDSIEEHGLETCLRVTPYVPHARALELQQKAQVLLLLEIDAPETTGIIPGKLFEYMAASRPVLAIGPVGWEAGQLVVETQCGAAFRYRDEEGIRTTLLDWYRKYREGVLEVKGKGIGAYHRKALTERLVKEILWV